MEDVDDPIEQAEEDGRKEIANQKLNETILKAIGDDNDLIELYSSGQVNSDLILAVKQVRILEKIALSTSRTEANLSRLNRN
jgi:hypothetical protein